MGEQEKWPRKNRRCERERGKGKRENVEAGKMGKLNKHHTKQPYVALKTKWETCCKCAKQGKGGKSQGIAS